MIWKTIWCNAFLSVLIAVDGATCPAGKMTTYTRCNGDLSSCNSATCCEADPMTCAGHIGSISCASGYYVDSAKYGATATYNNITKNAACCTAVATCTSYSGCSAGYKLKANPSSIKGTGGSSTLSNILCCELDSGKCAFHASSLTCATGKYYDATVSAGIAATQANKNTACCTNQAACSAGACFAGQGKKADLTGLYCATSSTAAASCNSICCEYDPAKCAYKHLMHGAFSCPAGKSYDPSVSAATVVQTGANKDTVCCASNLAACTAGACSPGYKKKASLTGLYCVSNLVTAAACNTACCELDNRRCAYYWHSISCMANFFRDATKYDAPVAVNGTDKNTVCCTPKITCNSYWQSCSTGYRLKSISCNGPASDCTDNVCCEDDPTTCGGIGNIMCPTNQFRDPAKDGLLATPSNKNIVCCSPQFTCAYLASLSVYSCSLGKYYDATTAAHVTASYATYNTVCCTADQSTCTAGTCSAGYKKRTSPPGEYCTSSATTAASCNSACCELDSGKCAFHASSLACAAGTYYDSSVSAGTVVQTGANKDTVCCASTATACTAATCAPGYMKKASLAGFLSLFYCTSAASCNTVCCEFQASTCAGYVNPACLAGTATGWYDCCSPSAVCFSAYGYGTRIVSLAVSTHQPASFLVVAACFVAMLPMLCGKEDK